MTRQFIRSETGAAMVVALLVLVVLSGLGAVVFTTATSNMQNAGRDRTAGGAMGASEAGIAQALAFMRDSGTGTLTCSGPPTYANCSNDWGYNYPAAGAGGHVVTLSGGQQFRVWIQRIKAYSPGSLPTPDGHYRIHSVGTQGTGPSRRTVTTDVKTRPFSYPLGVFGKDYVRSGGQTSISKESIFSRGCVGKRGNINFDTSANDLAYPDLVPAVHSARYISTSQIGNLTDPDCSPTERLNIHRPTSMNPPGYGVCHPDFKFDRDLQGGDLTSTVCHRTAPGNGGRGLTNSFFDENILKTTYGNAEPRGLPAEQYNAIRQIAQAQNNFYNCVGGPLGGADTRCTATGDLNQTGFTPRYGATLPNAVVYVRLPAGKTFTLSPAPGTPGSSGMLNDYGTRTPQASPVNYCGKRSVLLVVEGGNLVLNNNLDLIGSIFVPDGRADVSAGVHIVGTLFSKELFLNGDATFTLMGQCFFDNLPGGVQITSPFDFREIDR